MTLSPRPYCLFTAFRSGTDRWTVSGPRTNQDAPHVQVGPTRTTYPLSTPAGCWMVSGTHRTDDDGQSDARCELRCSGLRLESRSSHPDCAHRPFCRQRVVYEVHIPVTTVYGLRCGLRPAPPPTCSVRPSTEASTADRHIPSSIDDTYQSPHAANRCAVRRT